MKNYGRASVVLLVAGIALCSSVYTTSFGNGMVTRGFRDLGAPPTNDKPVGTDSATLPVDPMLPTQEKKVEEFFTGSRLKAEEAVKYARLIVIGQFVDVGHIGLDWPGQTDHENAKVEVLQTLKGDSSGPLSISFTVREGPPFPGEKAPELNRSYIIVINQGPLKASKILPDSEENFATVVNHIAAVSSNNP